MVVDGPLASAAQRPNERRKRIDSKSFSRTRETVSFFFVDMSNVIQNLLLCYDSIGGKLYTWPNVSESGGAYE